jgi:hypothetical protein
MAAKLSALRADLTLPPGFFIFKDSWYSFLLEDEPTPGPVGPEGLGQFKKSTSSGHEPATLRLGLPIVLFPSGFPTNSSFIKKSVQVRGFL